MDRPFAERPFPGIVDFFNMGASGLGEKHQVIMRRGSEKVLGKSPSSSSVAPSRVDIPIRPPPAATSASKRAHSRALDEERHG
jgi:hypothetical protein